MFRINSFIKKKAYCQINLSFLFFVITGKLITNLKFSIFIKKKKKKKKKKKRTNRHEKYFRSTNIETLLKFETKFTKQISTIHNQFLAFKLTWLASKDNL
jgi:hypothetical protein